MGGRIALLLLFTVWGLLPCNAQVPGQAPKKGGDPVLRILRSYRGHPLSLFMLRNDLIRKDLKLSEQQKADVDALMKGYARETGPGVRRMKDLVALIRSDPTDANKKALSDLCVSLNEHTQRYEGLALRLPTAVQRERLEQIRLRSRGVQIFFDSSLCEKLQLTAEQREQILKRASDCSRKWSEVAKRLRTPKADTTKGMKEMSSLRREAMDQAITVLTPTQRKKLDDLLGPKPAFDAGELVFKEVLEP